MSKVRDLINEQTDEKLNKVKDILSILYDAATAKSKLFGEEIEKSLRTAGLDENKTVPISFIVNTFEEIRVLTEDSVGIIDKIKDSIKDMLTGSSDKIVDGVAGLVKTVVEGLLGVSKGVENYKKCYYIATDGLSIVRLDMYFWCRSISVEAIKDYAEKSLVCTIYKSTIDVEKINFNTFLAVYQEQLGRMDFKKQELLEEIQNAKDIYKIMKEANNSSDVNELNSEVDSSYIVGELESSIRQVTGVWPPVK